MFAYTNRKTSLWQGLKKPGFYGIVNVMKKIENQKHDHKSKAGKGHSRNNKKHRYTPPKNLRAHDGVKKHSFIEGIFTIAGKQALVRERGTTKEKNVEIIDGGWNTALHGDSVKVKLLGTHYGVRQGEVTQIIVRNRAGYAGTLTYENGAYLMIPSDPKMYTSILIPEHAIGSAQKGQKVFVTLTKWEDPRLKPEGVIVEVLGAPGENSAEMHALALERGFATKFPELVLAEADSLAQQSETSFKEEARTRRDMRTIHTFTIDPFDAKDFDDALSVQENADGTYEIGIHIADVSYFVTPGSALDTEAIKRATSVYLVDRTIPMLPEVLSNDLCSLKPNEDRLTMSVIVTLDNHAKIIDTWYGRTIIRSQKRFTYEEAQQVLDEEHGTFFRELRILNILAKKLTKKRFQEGAISLDQEEVKFVLDANGVPTTVYRKIRGDTHRLVEEFMLLANRLVAEHIATLHTKKAPSVNDNQHEHLFLYRVHDKPSKEKIADLAYFLEHLGYPITLKNGLVPPAEINRLMKNLEGRPEKETVQSVVIRSMAKALYSTKNIGHYGLAFQYYTHFTSPIRRYPDIVAHRLLMLYLSGNHVPKEQWFEFETIAEVSSAREKEAADAERASIKYKQVEYMQHHIGKQFEGTITGVTEFGIFVEEKESKCEGLIRTRDLGNERFTLNEKSLTLIGDTTKKRFRIGDTVSLKVVRADLVKKVIDYTLAV